MHIELTEMLRCPEPHREEFLVLSTGEMSGRMVRAGIVGCPVCQREYEIVDGIVNFSGRGMRDVGRGPTPTHPPSPRTDGPGPPRSLRPRWLRRPPGFGGSLRRRTRGLDGWNPFHRH